MDRLLPSVASRLQAQANARDRRILCRRVDQAALVAVPASAYYLGGGIVYAAQAARTAGFDRAGHREHRWRVAVRAVARAARADTLGATWGQAKRVPAVERQPL